MPIIDQHGDTHPALSDEYDLEGVALHMICCTRCRQAMPWVWDAVQATEAQPNHGMPL